jgi:hypothetical protein
MRKIVKSYSKRIFFGSECQSYLSANPLGCGKTGLKTDKFQFIHREMLANL